ncbi:MAG: hypothetical protein H6736_20890 [Alphaproteobacteria bacterium]|nr:hypothetical protein [Alphaproteobacteria bacterium]
MLFLLSIAGATELHTCEATAKGPAGTELAVRAFGGSEADARRSVRQSARFLVDQRLLLDATLAWWAEDPEARDRLAGTVSFAGSADLAAPGWSLSPVTCAHAATPMEGRWTASWTKEGPEVHRAHPADALEASRRRACVSGYQIQVMQALKALADVPAEGRAAGLEPWRSAIGELEACWSATPPDTVPEERPVDATPTQCTALAHNGGRLAVGYGAGAERAAEDALEQSLLVRTRRLLGRVGRANAIVAAQEGEAAADAKIMEALGRIAGLTGPSDAVDRARLACTGVTPGPLRWKPTESEAVTCNNMSWTERPTTPVALADAGGFLDGTCALQVDPTLQIVRFSLRGATGEKRDQMVSSAYMITGTCESACYGNATWGTPDKPVVLEGAPDRTDKRAVLAELRALDAANPMAGLAFMPTLQDPESLAGLFDGTLVPALQAEASRLPAERWRQVDGHWILLPPE